MRVLLAGIVLSLLLAAPASAKIVKVTERDGFYGAVLAQLSDGRLLAGGALNVGHKQQYAIARFSRNGKRDRSFGTNGLAVATPGIGAFEDLRALFVQADGKIVGLGMSVYKDANARIGIARWTPDGKLDPTLDGDGVFMQQVNQNASMSFPEPFRGGFLVGGQTQVPRLDLAPPAWAQGLPGGDVIPTESKAFVAGVDGAPWQNHESSRARSPARTSSTRARATAAPCSRSAGRTATPRGSCRSPSASRD
jgi:uncharacterized delta-60 repeat protein